jgi:hypothetical protein
MSWSRQLSWLALASLPACTLTHSLDDLRGGRVTGGASGSTGEAGSTVGGNKAGEPSVAGAGGSLAGSSAGDAGQGTGVTGPQLIATGFSEHSDKQGFLEPIELQFNDEMDVSTLAGDGLCRGSLQLAKVGDELCIALGPVMQMVDEDGDPIAGRYSVQPDADLLVGASYELRATTDAKTETGVPLAVEASFAATAVYRHSIVIDGNNDFLPGEKLSTSSGGYFAYLAWDASTLYLGMSGGQIPEDDPSVFLLAYLGWPGVEPRSKVGQAYKAVTPQLSFDASHYARWQGANKGSSLMKFTSDMTWEEALLTMVGGKHSQKDTFVELAVPFAALSSTMPEADDVVPFVIFLLKETMGSESTFAAAPLVSGGSTATPQLSKHYALKLTDSLSFPNEYPAR